MMPLPRLFIACALPLALQEHLALLAQQLQLQLGGKASLAHNMHMTVAFMGATPEVQIPTILAALPSPADWPALSLRIDQIGHFGSGGIVWASCQDIPLPLLDASAALQQRLLAAGIRIDQRRWAPHITLLRHAQPLNAPLPAPLEWTIPVPQLYVSEPGPHYRIWPRTDG